MTDLFFENIRFAYRVNGKGYSVYTTGGAHNNRIRLDTASDGEVFSATLRTKSEIELVSIRAEFTYEFKSDDRILLNGYQSWTDTVEKRIDGRVRGIDQIPGAISDKYAFSAYGDYDFVKYSKKRGHIHGFSYGYIRNSLGNYDFFGSLNENSGFTLIKVNTAANTVTFEKDCRGVFINGVYDALKIYHGAGAEGYVFDRYFELLNIPKSDEKPVFGYTSWYRHYQDISEKTLLTDLGGLLVNDEQKADIFQIDDGYQEAVGDWLQIDYSKFPYELKPVTDKIIEAGLTPGIWLAPFVCEKKSELFRNHPDWLLKDDKGEPVRAGSNWSGSYALDIYNEEFRDYLREVFATVTGEWGFRLLKLDFLYAACILPRRNKTRGRVMADGMELLRELAGSAKILGCGVPLASAFGMVDYCRIGTDVSPDWNDKAYMQLMHRERPSTRNTILNSVFRRQLNGRAFINDPDVFMLRSTDTTMTTEQRRALAEINAMCGGVLFTSDNMAEYGDEQHKLLWDMLEVKGAEVLSAELDNGELVIAAQKDGKAFIRKYKV